MGIIVMEKFEIKDRIDIIRRMAEISREYMTKTNSDEEPCATASESDTSEKKKVIADDPDIMKFWDYEKNAHLNPKKIKHRSKKKAFWRCSVCGWEKETSISARAGAKGKCPGHDTFKDIVPGFSDFLTLAPDVGEYFDPEMNPGIDYRHLGVNSDVMIKWHCRLNCGNTWEIRVRAQVKKNKDGSYSARQCPCEKGRNTPYVLSQSEKALKYWDYEKNEKSGISLDNITVGSNKIVYWKCPNPDCGYSWEKSPKDQLGAVYMCPCCERQAVIVEGVNDLFTLCPEAREMFDFDANEKDNLRPETLTVTSGDKVHWKCKRCGNKWTQAVRNRFDGNGRFRLCKRCALLDIIGSTTVEDVPEMLKDWDYEKNSIKPAVAIITDTKKQLHWRREECGHRWTSSAFTRHRLLEECPVCTKEKSSVMTLVPQITEYILPEDNEGVDLDILKRLGVNNDSIPLSIRCPKCGTIRRNTFLKSVIKKRRDGTLAVCYCKECGIFRDVPYYEEFDEMKKMWDREFNGLDIEDVPRNEEKNPNYQWICQRPECGRSFKQSISILGLCFVRNSNGCPYCNRQKVIPGQSFADLHPELLDEYSSENDIDPYDVFPNSANSVLWKCTSDSSHPSWEATFAERHVGGAKCPVCFPRQVVPDVNTFAAIYPEFLHMYSDKNERDPNTFHYRSSVRFWWICQECGNEFSATCSSVVEGTYSCPYCNDRKVDPERNSLAAIYPELAKYWHERNEKPSDQVMYNAISVFHWKCKECGGKVRARIDEMLKDDYWCACRNSVYAKHPELADRWSERNCADFNHTAYRKDRVYYWNCPDCGTGNIFATIDELLNGNADCPVCMGRVAVPGLNTVYAKYPELADKWSERNDKDMDNTAFRENRKCYWNCPDCGTGYAYGTVDDILNGNYDCPVCRGKIVISEINSVYAKHPELTDKWSERNDKGIDQTAYREDRGYYWNCPDCGTGYAYGTIDDILNGTTHCPVCRGRVVVPGLNTVYAKHPELADKWSERNDKGIDQTAYREGREYYWLCSDCGTGYAYGTVDDILNSTTNCPVCRGRLVVPGLNTIYAKYPELADKWSERNDKDIDNTAFREKRKCYWNCPDCGTGFAYGTVDDILNGNYDCPVCRGKIVVPEINSVYAKHPELADKWSDRNGKGIDQTVYREDRGYYWNCPDCGTGYAYGTVSDQLNGTTHCRVCRGRVVIPGFNSFDVTQLQQLRDWDYVANYGLGILPSDISERSSKRVWWTCEADPNHHYIMSPASRTFDFLMRKKEPCPYCKGRRRKLRRFF